MTGRASVIAVVDDTGQGVAVWWVTVEPEALSMLCGAWVLDPVDPSVLEFLVVGRMVLATKSGSAALRAAKVKPGRLVDVHASLSAARADRQRLQDAFDAEQATRPASKRLKEPRWPSFPDELDVEDPPPWDVNHPNDDHMDTALSISHWVAGLCSRWSDLEEERLARPLLRELGGPDARPIPVVCA